MSKKFYYYAAAIFSLIVTLALGVFGLDPYLCVIVYFSLAYLLSLLIARGERSGHDIAAAYYEERLGDGPGVRAKVARFKARLEDHKYVTLLLPLAMITLTTYLMRLGLPPAVCTVGAISTTLGYIYYLAGNTRV